MTNVPQLRAHGNPAPRPDSSRSRTDLIAFLAVLALGVILVAVGHETAGSVAMICGALGGLFVAWRHAGSPDNPHGGEQADQSGRRPDEPADQPR